MGTPRSGESSGRTGPGSARLCGSRDPGVPPGAALRPDRLPPDRLGDPQKVLAQQLADIAFRPTTRQEHVGDLRQLLRGGDPRRAALAVALACRPVARILGRPAHHRFGVVVEAYADMRGAYEIGDMADAVHESLCG